MRISLILLLLFVHVAALAQAPPDPSLTYERDNRFVPYRHKDKWGIMRKNKKWAVKPKHVYDSVSMFYVEVAVVKVNNKLGLIDTTGKVVATPIYSSIKYNESEQYYELKEDGKATTYFLYDKRIYPQVPDTYDVFEGDYLTEFFEVEEAPGPDRGRLTTYYSADGKVGVRLEKRNGEVLASEKAIPAVYDKLIKSGGYYIAQKGNNWGLVEAGNKVLIPIEYEIIKVIGHGDSYPVQKNGKWGVFDISTNNAVVPTEYDDVIVTSGKDGYGYRLLKGGKMGYYSLDSKKIIAPAYKFIRGFNNNRISPVITLNGKFGYVNLDGYEYFKD